MSTSAAGPMRYPRRDALIRRAGAAAGARGARASSDAAGSSIGVTGIARTSAAETAVTEHGSFVAPDGCLEARPSRPDSRGFITGRAGHAPGMHRHALAAVTLAALLVGPLAACTSSQRRSINETLARNTVAVAGAKEFRDHDHPLDGLLDCRTKS